MDILLVKEVAKYIRSHVVIKKRQGIYPCGVSEVQLRNDLGISFDKMQEIKRDVLGINIDIETYDTISGPKYITTQHK